MYHFPKSGCPTCGGKKKVRTIVAYGVISCKCHKCGWASKCSLKPPVFRGVWVPPASP